LEEKIVNCRRCGAPLKENQTYCSQCGTPVFYGSNTPTERRGNSYAVVGFILSLLSIWLSVLLLIVNIISITLCVKGRRFAKEFGGEGRNLCTAGITISIITGSFWLLLLFLSVIIAVSVGA